jgi:peptidoglycan/xylan/chitin deacetylase (PgdA/CDA1 family)
VPGAEKEAVEAGLTIALWSVDPRDWAVRSSKTIRTRAKEGLGQPNPVVLLHDGGGDRRATVAALPGIIEDYRSAGYAFVTLARP